MDYHIRPLGKVCAATGQPLTPGSVCMSVLVAKGDDLQRMDYSLDAWQGPPAGCIAQWQSQVPWPVEVKKKRIDPDALMSYFEQLTEEANPVHDKLRYILAILLLHKRRLKDEGTQSHGDDEFLVFSGMQGEGTFEVRNFVLSDQEVTELQETLNAHLQAEGSSGIEKLSA